MLDRIVGVLTYITMGIFGLIWLIFSYVTGRKITSFVAFNIYQSMFILAIFSIFSLEIVNVFADLSSKF